MQNPADHEWQGHKIFAPIGALEDKATFALPLVERLQERLGAAPRAWRILATDQECPHDGDTVHAAEVLKIWIERFRPDDEVHTWICRQNPANLSAVTAEVERWLGDCPPQRGDDIAFGPGTPQMGMAIMTTATRHLRREGGLYLRWDPELGTQIDRFRPSIGLDRQLVAGAIERHDWVSALAYAESAGLPDDISTFLNGMRLRRGFRFRQAKNRLSQHPDERVRGFRSDLETLVISEGGSPFGSDRERVCDPAFSLQTLRKLTPLRFEVLDLLDEAWERKDLAEYVTIMKALAEIVGSDLFDAYLRTLEHEDMKRCVDRLLSTDRNRDKSRWITTYQKWDQLGGESVRIALLSTDEFREDSDAKALRLWAGDQGLFKSCFHGMKPMGELRNRCYLAHEGRGVSREDLKEAERDLAQRAGRPHERGIGRFLLRELIDEAHGPDPRKMPMEKAARLAMDMLGESA